MLRRRRQVTCGPLKVKVKKECYEDQGFHLLVEIPPCRGRMTWGQMDKLRKFLDHVYVEYGEPYVPGERK
jgi:hypothetical protein